MSRRGLATRLPSFFVILLALLVFSPCFSPNNVSLRAEPQRVAYRDLIDSMILTNIESNISYFAGLGSRITGYPGCQNAGKHIFDVFNAYLQNVTTQNFTVTVPIDYGATMKVLSPLNEYFAIYPLEPNMVVPVIARKLTGPLIYVEDGKLEDLENKTIKDSIVIMNFNSEDNWLNAVKFGAKAVVFIEPSETNAYECLEKSVMLPVNFPRFYMPRSDVLRLLAEIEKRKEPLYAQIDSFMRWENRVGSNIIGILEGSVKNQYILLSAYYDSYSVVPSVSPCANEAVGISILLELARLYNIHRPPYSLIFVAFSGHHQGIAGSRAFVNEYLFGKNREIGVKIILQVDIGLVTTRSMTLGTTNTGDFYPLFLNGWFHWQPAFFIPLNNYVTSELANNINSETKGDFQLVSGIIDLFQHGNMYIQYDKWPVKQSCDLEPLAMNEGPGFGLATVDWYNAHLLSPVDDYSRINKLNLRKNSEAVACVLYGLASTPNLKEKYLASFAVRNNFLWFRGQAAVYNETVDVYDPLPDTIIWWRNVYSNYWELLRGQVSFTDSKGYFSLEGLTDGQMAIQAFKLDETTGNVIYALTRGRYRWAQTSFGRAKWGYQWGEAPLGITVDIGYVSLFKCGTFVILDSFFYPTLDLSQQIVISVLDHYTHAAPDYYGYETLDGYAKRAAHVFYVPPERSIDVIYEALLQSLAAVLNVTDGETGPWGHGWQVNVGEQYILTSPPLTFAKSLHNLAMQHVGRIERYGLTGGYTGRANEVQAMIERSENMIANNHYADGYALGIAAWAAANNLYIDVAYTVIDGSGTVILFSILIIPFTLLLERLVLRVSGRRELLAMLVIFSALVAIFNFVHPAFRLAFAPVMTIMGIATFFLIAPAIILLFSYIPSSIRELTVKVSGVHEAGVSKGSAIMLAMQVGIENIKKRKLRSSLTIVTVILIIAGIVMTTSIQSITVARPYTVSIEPPYYGVYIKKSPSDWLTLSDEVVSILRARYSDIAYVLPASWKYTRLVQMGGGGEIRALEATFRVQYGGNVTKVYCALGLDPKEYEVNPAIRSAVIKGTWFEPDTTDVCLLPENIARVLNLEIGKQVYAFGRNLTVTGIFDPNVFNKIMNIDREEITPRDIRVTGTIVHVRAQEIMILPYSTIRQMEYFDNAPINNSPIIATVKILPKDKNATTIQRIAQEISMTFNHLYTFIGLPGKVTLYSRYTFATILGWQQMIVPSVISALILLNVMIGSIKERQRDIFAYSSVGLSPVHVSSMFLGETVAFAIVGVVLGYILAMSLSTTFSSVVAGILLNYSSSFVVLAIGMTMAIIATSSIYALIMTARTVTPSLERKWKVPTKPKGDIWNIPLPFFTEDDAEVSQICRYIQEFAKLHVGRAEIFAVEKIDLIDRPEAKGIFLTARLAPYDRGVVQDAEIVFQTSEKTRRWVAAVLLTRKAGDITLWRRLAFDFVDLVRKQLLFWRGLSPEKRARYEKD